ncbi:hypothetical protein CDV36_010496 [Fusarium kuroshium]|uniref:Uncharacterized protein n=1 Tax=Fusarium kuroshium TaxID=2010991 RepID=A0A3M2RXD7_9HYPO|nr:hypothetical protein CDV36_010496 [Fusarium kuroshium]
MSQYATIPSTPAQWASIVSKTHETGDPFAIDISQIEPNSFGSASKLKYEDWLLLRVLWKKSDGRPTHQTIFGPIKGSELRAAAERKLAEQSWMNALKKSSNNTMEWSYMAPWKLNLSEIASRRPAVRSQNEGSIYDDADPFRLLVEPSHRRRPHRNTVPRNPAGPSASARSSSQSSSSTFASRESPTRSDELAVSSGSPGSLRGRLGTSSPESGTSFEAKMINKHRPDEALINMTLLLLLQGVCMPLLQPPHREEYGWSIVQKQFSVSYPDPETPPGRSKILTARTDGCLQVRRPNREADKPDVLAIIEVKPYFRSKPKQNEIAVQIQEGAEMASWISTESMKGMLPTKPESNMYRRLLISQDFDEVFITIAEFDDLYVKYIKGDNNIDWLKGSDETSPSRGSRPGVEPKKTPEKKAKDGTQGPPGPGPDSPPGPSAASAHLPFRSRITPAPVTPSRPGSTKPEETPQAPKQGTSTVKGKGAEMESKGFLWMHQFTGFRLQSPADVYELALLLWSLTDYLTGSDAAQSLRYERSVPDRSRGSK